MVYPLANQFVSQVLIDVSFITLQHFESDTMFQSETPNVQSSLDIKSLLVLSLQSKITRRLQGSFTVDTRSMEMM